MKPVKDMTDCNHSHQIIEPDKITCSDCGFLFPEEEQLPFKIVEAIHDGINIHIITRDKSNDN